MTIWISITLVLFISGSTGQYRQLDPNETNNYNDFDYYEFLHTYYDFDATLYTGPNLTCYECSTLQEECGTVDLPPETDKHLRKCIGPEGGTCGLTHTIRDGESCKLIHSYRHKLTTVYFFTH